MSLETAFYTIGIITMALWLLIIGFVIAVYFKIKHEIRSFKESFWGNLVDKLKQKNSKVASAVGLALAGIVIDKIKDRLTSDSDEQA